MKYALVLSGGGAKGAYQAGCIKALQELGIDFDIVTGTSIGALNGLLVVQKDYDALYQLWQEIKISDVLANPINFEFSVEAMMNQSNLIKPFFKSYLNEKGADITPLKNRIYQLYDDQKTFSSNIDYGIVTVEYPKLTPLEITKEQMQSKQPVEYALASAACFPAFPVHYINNQGYVDGGYYDNLPIALALKMKAKQIIAIELNQEATHEGYLERPYLKIIRPSYDLSGFLDFNREILDWRIKLGYFDTLKSFNKIKGYKYNFKKTNLNEEIINKLYWQILYFESNLDKSLVSKTLFNTNTPLTDLLKKDTYLKNLKLEDYFIRTLEIAMAYYHYQSDLLYDINSTYQEIYNHFMKSYYQQNQIKKQIKNTTIKEIFATVKNLSSQEALYAFYHALINHEIIEIRLINNLFLNEYLVALLMFSLK